MARAGRYPLVFEATGTATGKMRNEIHIAWPGMDQRWDMATDEAPNLGGEDTAPPPLAFFMTALVGCAMTQVRMMARQMKVQVDGLTVRARAEWVRDVPERGVHVADTEGYAMEFEIDSPSDPEAVQALVLAAQRGCFVEHSLANPSRITHRLKHGATDWIAVDDGAA
jgi:uncharacterized OsmC-like protein